MESVNSPLQYLFFIAFFVVIYGGYWYLSKGRYGSGKEFHQKRFKLEPGEELTPNYPLTGQYKIDHSLKDKIINGITNKRGVFLLIALTNKGRMILVKNESKVSEILTDKPKVYLKKNMLSVELKGEEGSVGIGAAKEKKVYVSITMKDNTFVPLILNETFYHELKKWFATK